MMIHLRKSCEHAPLTVEKKCKFGPLLNWLLLILSCECYLYGSMNQQRYPIVVHCVIYVVLWLICYLFTLCLK